MPKHPERNHLERQRLADADSEEAVAPSEFAPTDAGPTRAKAPGIVAPSSRVNVAFPFSKITLHEPSKELVELAALVHDLVATMAEWVPEDRLDELQARAQALRDTLR